MSASDHDAPVAPALHVSCLGGLLATYLALPDHVHWSARLDAGSWLTFDSGSATTGSGQAFVILEADRNTGPARAATLTIADAGGVALLVYPVTQVSAEPLATLNRSVLELPFSATPRVLELGIAGKFVAAQIKKIPDPFNLIALVIAELVVVALGLIAIAVRALFASAVPEPRTWFGAPPTFEELTAILPATAICITEETYLLALYILESQR